MARITLTIPPSRPSAPVEPVEPTAEEARNGWSAEALGRYKAERDAAHQLKIAASMAGRLRPPLAQANGHRWAFPVRRGWAVKASWNNNR